MKERNPGCSCLVLAIMGIVVVTVLGALGAWSPPDKQGIATNNLWTGVLLIAGVIFVTFFLMGLGGSPRMSHGGMYGIAGLIWMLVFWGFTAIFMLAGPTPGNEAATLIERITWSSCPFALGIPGFLLFLDGTTTILRTFKDYYTGDGGIRGSSGDEPPQLALGRIFMLVVVLFVMFFAASLATIFINGGM